MLTLRAIVNLAAVRRTFIRTVAVNSASVNTSETTQDLKPWQEIPGPSSLPLIGPLWHFLPGNDLSHVSTPSVDLMHKKYGKIVRLDGLLGRPTIIFIYDAESCATVLRGENSMPIRPGLYSLEYYKKKYNKTKEESLKPTGLGTDHGENWREFRSKVNPVLLQPKTIRLYSTVLSEVAEEMIGRMKSKRNHKNMLEGKFDVEMNLWALESIGVVALGTRLNCFDPNLPEDSPARKLIRCVHKFFYFSDELDFKPSLWRYVSTPLFRKAMKNYEEMNKLSKHFVDKALAELKIKQTSDEEKRVLEKLLEIDEHIALLMANDMLIAGVDTIAMTITATLYLLATNQEKQDKLREEVTSEREQRPYLRACIKESLRVMPVGVGNLRRTTKEYNILGYKIPKDMDVFFCHQYLSNMEEMYPNAKEFIPERWLDKSYTSAHPFAYSPFGFGVRSCIGRRIAKLEMEIFLSKLIQNFKVEWFGPPIKVKPTILNYLVEPFNFVFKDVK